MSTTKNVGQVAGLFIGTSAPQNTTLIWFDSTTNQRCHKVFDPKTGLWKVLEPGIVALTTYSELVNNAKKNGLSIGKLYQITDKSNVLAITIGTTRVQYVDSLGNILVDDLGTNIQYHVSSGNILIDGVGGVYDTDTSKLVFSFTEKTQPESSDYILGKEYVGNKWRLFKFGISSLLSKVTGNSITWNKGIFFNFSSSVKSLLNKKGGIVGYDQYEIDTKEIDNQIKQISKNNQTIVQNADEAIKEQTKDESIFNKKIKKNIDVATAPGDILLNDTLFTIVSKIQRWINQFKYATGIKLSKSFKDAKNAQYINNNDTVESAFGKIQYILKNLTTSGKIPEDWSDIDLGDKPDGGFSLESNDSVLIAIRKLYENSVNINHGQLGDKCVDYDKIENIGVFSTDVVRFELNSNNPDFFGAGCGIGGVVSKYNFTEEEGDTLGRIFIASSEYPKDPYRIRGQNLDWSKKDKFPQILSFAPVVYFSESNSQNHYTNAASFVHVKETLCCQFIIYFSDEALGKIRASGKDSLDFEMQIDVYGVLTNKQIVSLSDFTKNVVIASFNIPKETIELVYYRNIHIVFYMKII